jgi:hypothetical protein
MLRRAAGVPVQVESYFTVEIIPGKMNRECLGTGDKD